MQAVGMHVHSLGAKGMKNELASERVCVLCQDMSEAPQVRAFFLGAVLAICDPCTRACPEARCLPHATAPAGGPKRLRSKV